MFNRPTCKVQIDICGTKSELTLLELFGVFKGISFFGGAGGGEGVNENIQEPVEGGITYTVRYCI